MIFHLDLYIDYFKHGVILVIYFHKLKIHLKHYVFIFANKNDVCFGMCYLQPSLVDVY
jgi:hypothetical protein